MSDLIQHERWLRRRAEDLAVEVQDQRDAFQRELEVWMTTVDKLSQALIRFGDHSAGCGYRSGGDCICGFSEALDLIREGRDET